MRALDTDVHFSLHVRCSCVQIDKSESERERERWRVDDVCVYKYKKKKGMVRVTLNGAKTLSDVTQSRRYAVFVRGEIALHYAMNAV